MKNTTKIVIKIGDQPDLVTLTGRQAWCVDRLVTAGESGITSIESPGARVAHFVFLLRKEQGLSIETEREQHTGPYPGGHGRYRLRTPVKIIAREVKP